MKLVVVVVALFGALASADGLTVEVRSVAAEQPPDVHVLLRVTDGAGKPVAGLTTADVEVFDDGQPVTSFELRQSHPDSQPVALSVLLDISGSMSQEDVAAAASATQALVGKLTPEDRYEIVAFNSEIHVVKSFDQPLDPAALEALTPTTDTKLNDAISGALDRIAAVPASERAIVVLTDGVDDGSAIPTAELLARVATAGVPIHTMGLGDVDGTVLETIGRSTGGSFQRADEGGELAGLYASIASSLLTEYRLSFASAFEPGPHDMTVVVTAGGQTATANVPYVLGRPRLNDSPTEEPAPQDSSPVLYVAVAAVGLLVLLLVAVLIATITKRGRTPVPQSPRPVLPLPPGSLVDGLHLVGDGGVFPITGRLVLGRDPMCDVVVGHETVSRSHAQLERCNGGVRVQDLGSSNGTRINGAPVDDTVARPGDRIAFGDVDFELRGPVG